MKKSLEVTGFGEHEYVELNFYEKWLVFWRLLKTGKFASGYSIEEILEDGF